MYERADLQQKNIYQVDHQCVNFFKWNNVLTYQSVVNCIVMRFGGICTI